MKDDEWINVRDKLPDNYSMVMVFMPKNYVNIGISDFISGRFLKTNVTHWMPFPSPPKNREIK